MKKTLAIILTLALVICMMPASVATAYAAEANYDLAKAKIELPSEAAYSYTYDGTAKEPMVTVKDGNGNVVASEKYDVTYNNPSLTPKF